MCKIHPADNVGVPYSGDSQKGSVRVEASFLSPNRTTGRVEWVDRRTRAIRSFDERALLGWRIIITNPTNYYQCPHAIKFIRSFVSRGEPCRVVIWTPFFFLSESESPSLADKIYQLTHYRLLRNRELVENYYTTNSKGDRKGGLDSKRAVFVTFIGWLATVFYDQF